MRDAITSRLITGHLAPGQRIIETDLKCVLGVSRGAVREALQSLSAIGLVRLRLHHGANITVLEREDALDLLATFEPLAGLIARLAAQAVASGRGGVNHSDVRGLAHYVESDVSTRVLPAERYRFYDRLIRIGRNSQLPSMAPTMLLQLLRLQAVPYLDQEAGRRGPMNLSTVAAAVLSGQPVSAEIAMTEHVKQRASTIARLPSEAFADRTEEIAH